MWRERKRFTSSVARCRQEVEKESEEVSKGVGMVDEDAATRERLAIHRTLGKNLKIVLTNYGGGVISFFISHFLAVLSGESHGCPPKSRDNRRPHLRRVRGLPCGIHNVA